MSDWLDDLAGDSPGGACVLVSVARTRGSCPREAGTRMLVTGDDSRGTIGGGHLEYRAIDIARGMLAASTAPRPPRLERFPLGARLGQCCGGLVHLSFEHVPAERPAWVARLLAIRRSRGSAVIVTRVESPPAPSSAPEVRDPEPTHRQAERGHGTAKRIVVPFPDEELASDRVERTAGESPCVSGHRSEHASPLPAPPPASAEHWRRAESRARALLQESPVPTTRWEPPFLYEPFLPERFDICLFGAGHVGRAVIDVLHPLPCSITWIDSRESEFPAAAPDNVCLLPSDRPEDEVDDAPPGSYLIVMTHSHALDQAICERALRRTDLAWCGLIGSMSKRRRFEQRLLARGLERSDLARLVCPIGVSGISGKHPAEIAIAVAADVLRTRERRLATTSDAHRAA